MRRVGSWITIAASLSVVACARPQPGAPLQGSAPEVDSRCKSEIAREARARVRELEKEAGVVFGTDAQFIHCHPDSVGTPPGPSDADLELYRSGVCLEVVGELETALASYESLLLTFPKTLLASKAMIRAGYLDARLGRWSAAATRLEEYANRYSGEKDASDALSDATTYRVMIGQDELALADIRQFERNFGVRRRVPAHLRCLGQ